jgi:hypothetical protein
MTAMKCPQHPRASELRNLAALVTAIDADDNPLNADIARAIVHHELNMLEDETAASEEARVALHIDKLEEWVKGIEETS